MSAPKEFPCGPGPSVLAVMTRTKVLVTSSAGYLGEVLTRVLRGRGYQVTGQDLRGLTQHGRPAPCVTGAGFRSSCGKPTPIMHGPSGRPAPGPVRCPVTSVLGEARESSPVTW